MKLYTFFYSLILIIGLTACGQQGPLYLPGDEPPIHVEPEEE